MNEIYKQYREGITTFLNRKALLPLTDAVPDTFICGLFHKEAAAALVGVLYTFLTEEETQSVQKNTLFLLHQEASMTC